MRCPKCKFRKSEVFDVRKYITFVLRTRRCKKCRHEWKTQETEISFDKFIEDSFGKPINNKSGIGGQNNLFNNEGSKNS